jgi:predicted lactoylglutathione lyase
MIGENVDLVAMITFVVSNLSLEASIYQNLGFILNPRREDGEKSFGRREMGKK